MSASPVRCCSPLLAVFLAVAGLCAVARPAVAQSTQFRSGGQQYTLLGVHGDIAIAEKHTGTGLGMDLSEFDLAFDHWRLGFHLQTVFGDREGFVGEFLADYLFGIVAKRDDTGVPLGIYEVGIGAGLIGMMTARERLNGEDWNEADRGTGFLALRGTFGFSLPLAGGLFFLMRLEPGYFLAVAGDASSFTAMTFRLGLTLLL